MTRNRSSKTHPEWRAILAPPLLAACGLPVDKQLHAFAGTAAYAGSPPASAATMTGD